MEAFDFHPRGVLGRTEEEDAEGEEEDGGEEDGLLELEPEERTRDIIS